jgi:hypothetical protein
MWGYGVVFLEALTPVPLSQFRSNDKAVLTMGEGEPISGIFLKNKEK